MNFGRTLLGAYSGGATAGDKAALDCTELRKDCSGWIEGAGVLSPVWEQQAGLGQLKIVAVMAGTGYGTAGSGLILTHAQRSGASGGRSS